MSDYCTWGETKEAYGSASVTNQRWNAKEMPVESLADSSWLKVKGGIADSGGKAMCHSRIVARENE